MQLSIFAPVGKFADVKRAAQGEAGLDWLGPITSEHEACTLSFAATEISQCFLKLPGVSVTLNSLDSNIPLKNTVILATANLSAKKLKEIEDIFGNINVSSQEQSFIIKTRKTSAGTQYLILGIDRAGALYGTYEFLEAFGFRWLGPAEYEEVAPSTITEPLPVLDTKQSPSFVARGYWLNTDRGGNPFVHWMARNRLNVWSINAQDKAFCRKLCMIFQDGFHDAMEQFLSPKKYFQDHPTWYGLKNGKRCPPTTLKGVNICCSNSMGVHTFAENVVEDLIFGQSKWADYYQVITSDNGTWCECEECRKLGTPTDQLMLLLYECRKAVKKAISLGRLHRDVKIGAASYLETKEPPTLPLPIDFDHEGTFVTFFPIERCYAHSFPDSKCTEINVVLKTFYEGWTKPSCSFHGAKFIGEYYNVSKFSGLMLPLMQTMSVDIPYYYKTGARMMHYMHIITADWGPISLTNLQFAAQTWNHLLNCESFLERYLKDRYQSSAKEMCSFYTIMEAAMRNIQAWKHIPNFNAKDHLFHTLRQKGDPLQPKTYLRSKHLKIESENRIENDGPTLSESVELIEQAAQILNKVILECKEGPMVRQRLADDARRFQYTRNMTSFYMHFVQLRLLENRGYFELAASEARMIKDIGETLRSEDRVVRNGCEDSKVLFKNSLLASWLSKPYLQVMKDYSLDVLPLEDDGVT